jgi:hypothetical protein
MNSENGLQILENLLEPLDDEAKNTVLLEVQNTFGMPPISRETIPGLPSAGDLEAWPSIIRGQLPLLDFDKVEQMMATGQIAYPMAMKKAPIISIVNSESGFTLESPDERLAELLHANLSDVLPRAIDDMLTFLEYGAYYSEVTWEPGYPQDYGLTKSPVPYWLIEDFNSVHPTTVEKIVKDEKTRAFKGFIQQASWQNEPVMVGLDRALIVPHNGTFANLAGQSILEPVYVWWFWYELVWRAFLRFLQRAGVGVVLVKAPSRGRVVVNNVAVANVDWALQLASSLHRTNYAVVPSDAHRENHQPLWAVEYLKTGDRGEAQQFIEALNLLSDNIRKYLLTGSEKTDDKSEYDVMIDTERVLSHIGTYLSRYVLRKALIWNGSKARRMLLRFQGADTRTLPLLFKLMAVAGNTAGDALRNVHWRELFTKGGVPVLTEEEVEELRKKEQQEEERQKQRDFSRSWQQRKETEKAKGQPGGEGSWASKRDSEGKSEKLEELSAVLDTSVIVLGAGQVVELEEMGIRVDSGSITLFNPYHDPQGRFTDRAHAVRPLAKKKYHQKGKLSPRAEFRVKDAAAVGFEKAKVPQKNVRVYRKKGDFIKAVCGDVQGNTARVSCSRKTKKLYAVYKNGEIHVGPRGVYMSNTNRKFGQYIFTHEAFHGRKRSDGSFEADLSYTGNKLSKSYRSASSRMALEEGSTDLLARKAMGVNERYWAGITGPRHGYSNYMAAIAILAGKASGWDRDEAWRIIDKLHYHINDEQYIQKLLTQALGTPVGGWEENSTFITMQRLQHAAKWNQWRSMGWLFGKPQRGS